MELVSFPFLLLTHPIGVILTQKYTNIQFISNKTFMICLNYMHVLMTILMEKSEIPGGEHLAGYRSQDSIFLTKN